MKKREDLTGKKFSRLTVVKFHGTTKDRRGLWECKCECGGNVIVIRYHLISGNTKSCGCLQKEILLKRSTTHNKRHTKEYNVWNHIKSRCLKKYNKAYHNYGGRGIKICDRWTDKDFGFLNFLADMGVCPSDSHSIDRIDNDGNYCSENCRWATIEEQSRNKRVNVWHEYNGEKLILQDWVKKFKVNRSSVDEYIKKHGFKKAYIHYTSKLNT